MRSYDRSEVNAFGRSRRRLRKRHPRERPSPPGDEQARTGAQGASQPGDQPAQHAPHRAEAGRRHQGQRQHEAARILREAEGRSDLLLHKSQSRLEDVQREIDGLRMKRREVETSLEGIIATINNTITFVREQDAAHREEKILLHRPRQLDPPPVPQPQAQAQAVNQTHPASAPHPSPATQAANPSLPNLLHPSHLAHLRSRHVSDGVVLEIQSHPASRPHGPRGQTRGRAPDQARGRSGRRSGQRRG